MRNVKKFIHRETYDNYISSTGAVFPNVSVCYIEKKVFLNNRLNVVNVTSVTLNENSINLYVGDREQLVPTVMPTNATYKDVVWSSSDSGVATVSSDGFVSGVSEGDAVITVTTTDGGFTAQCSVSVANVLVTSVTINKNETVIILGECEVLSATVLPSNATNKGVTWSSSDSGVATVSSEGLVSGVSKGTVNITATANDGSNVSASCSVAIRDYASEYLTFNVRTDGDIAWMATGSGYNKVIEYSKNDGEWTPITASSTTKISVVTGDVVRFRGTNQKYASSKSNYAGFEGGSAYFDIEGNIMSLISGDSFTSATAMSGTYNFCSMFKKSLVVSAENLVLPCTTLTNYCYRALFSWCTTLTKAPKLPATTLAQGCYWYMFEQCAIEEAPELLAPTLVRECYGNMFNSCASLNYIKCLATTNLDVASGLTTWVSGVSESGTFVKDENTTWTTGNSGIPTNWVVYDGDLLHSPIITCDGEHVTITCETSGAEIYHRLNHSGEYSLYTSPITITADTYVEAFSKSGSNQSSVVSQECVYVEHVFKLGGLEFARGPLYYGNDGYAIRDSWNYDSYNTSYGKVVGSSYFNFIEMGELYDTTSFTTSNGNIVNNIDLLDGWRLPTDAEWQTILGTTRDGSTVNGSSNKHYAMIELNNVTHASSSSPRGMLVFPDGETIDGAPLANMDNATLNLNISEAQLNSYLNQGCAFLPCSGYYDNGFTNGGTYGYYLSSSEYNTANAYYVTFNSGNLSTNAQVSKTSVYTQVFLVKDLTYNESPLNGATKSIDNWMYNNNSVDLPYSINAIDGHSSKYSTGVYNFTSSVDIKKAQPTYLWFEHADQSAEIYVDNVLVTTHWGGYNAFFADITNNVHVGTNNIKVAICNTTRTTLAPCEGDFNFNATLGRVKMINSPVRPLMDYGYDGFHVTSVVTATSATVTVTTSLPNEADVICRIDDNEDDTYHFMEKKHIESGVVTFTATINNPHLWNGTADPFLYDITLEIYHNGDLYHRLSRPYGLRYYDYVYSATTILPNNESYTGFLLNGSPYQLRGVCMHSDKEEKANALSSDDIANDFAIIQELGCNFIRLAHYPHPKEVYDWCDRMGIIVQTEVPWVNNAQSTQPSAYYEHLNDQYRDMVNQHYNHPSIMFWGLSNETTTDDKDFAKEKVEGYRTLIKSLDAERWVGYVVSHSVSNPSAHFNNPNMDWFGSNIYVGWYVSKDTNNPTTQLSNRVNNTINNLHKPLAFSEYGAGGTQHCHSDNFTATTTSGNYPRHDIEYQMWLHEGHIAAIRNFPQLLFTAQWQLFDIAVAKRNEGYTVCLDGVNATTDENLKHLNNKGLVERDHVTKKDTFYVYKAEWSSEKFVHICCKDYLKKTDRVIKCYSNDGSGFTMFVNGVQTQTAQSTNNIVIFSASNFNNGDEIMVSGATTSDRFRIYDYVEIGGVKWAIMNVGANSVTDGGLYFQWGDTVGYTADQVGSGEGKKFFYWSDYKWSTSGGSTMTKYNSTDGKTVLDISDDAARANMGDLWRIPTSAECQALLDTTTSAWTTDYQGSGVSGLVLTSKADSNVNLFFPAVGSASNGSVSKVGSIGCVWSSSLDTSLVSIAHNLGFNSTNAKVSYTSRCYGFSVRGVMDI